MQDNIQAVGTEEKYNVNSERVANSIRFRQESVKMTKQRYDELLSLIAKKEETIEKVKEAVKQDVENGTSYEKVVSNNLEYATKIAALEEQIDILSATSGPMELVDKRAIRLIDKMYKEVSKTSDAIYLEIVKRQAPATDSFEPIQSEELVIPSIDVEKIALENAPVVDNSVETAINEQKEVVTEAPVQNVAEVPTQVEETPVQIEQPQTEPVQNVTEVPTQVVEAPVQNVTEVPTQVVEAPVQNVAEVPTQVEETPIQTDFDLQRIEREINKKIEKYISDNNENSIFAVEDQIAKEREDNLLAQYYGLNEANTIKEQEVAKANEAKEFDFSTVFTQDSEPVLVTDTDDKPLRDDDLMIVSDREVSDAYEIPEYETVDETDYYGGLDLGEPAIVEDIIPKRSIVLSSLEKEKAHAVLEKVRAARARRKELEQEENDVNLDLESQKEINAQAALKEDEAKKNLERSIEEANRAEREYTEAVTALEEELAALNSENDTMSINIESAKEQIASIQEDTASRNRTIEDLDIENESKQEEIAKYKELRDMLSFPEEYIEKQKVA